MIERVTCFPNEGTPEVVPGDPQAGDIVRIDGKIYQRYMPPSETPAPLEARTLTWDQFLDVGMATDAVKTNAILINMPVVGEYGRKYVNTPGIEYADAITPGARLHTLMGAAKQAGLIDLAFEQQFLATWKAMFP